MMDSCEMALAMADGYGFYYFGHSPGKTRALELASLRVQARQMPCHDHTNPPFVMIVRPMPRHVGEVPRGPNPRVVTWYDFEPTDPDNVLYKLIKDKIDLRKRILGD